MKKRTIILFILFVIVNIANIDFAVAQSGRKVTGRVMDEHGELLIGVNVMEEGTTNGVVTDINGTYTITLSKDNSSLTFTYVGFKDKKQKVGNQNILDVQLDENVESLDELVIVGYGTQKKVSVTAAVSDVQIENVQRIATPSLSNALAGSMPGIVSRQSSGEPGYDGSAIFIRGFGTWENRNPLVLVDGIQRDINNINTQEIESLTILKDASATAVYGVQGANGVILITTKRGKIGKPKIVFRSEVAGLQALRLPNYINGYEYASLMNEAQRNVGNAPVYNEQELGYFKDGSQPYFYPDVDWVNTILKKTPLKPLII